MKVLVVGANGRLGRACVEALHRKGQEVVAFVRQEETFPSELRERCVAVVEGDARQLVKQQSALRDHSCDGIIQAGGYTPVLPWISTDMDTIFQASLDAAESIARERTGGQNIDPNKRLRVWMINDLAVMDSPWEDGQLLKTYLPPVFVVHRRTYGILVKRSPDDVAWSLMCPSQMVEGTGERDVTFGGPKVPHWSPVLHWVPIVGRHLNALLNGLLYMQTTFSTVAAFIADDFTLGLTSGLVGKKVAPHH